MQEFKLGFSLSLDEREMEYLGTLAYRINREVNKLYNYCIDFPYGKITFFVDGKIICKVGPMVEEYQNAKFLPFWVSRYLLWKVQEEIGDCHQ